MDTGIAVQDVATKAAERIQELWKAVVKTVNTIIEVDGKFGFSHIEANLNPKIEDIVNGLRLVEVTFNTILDSGQLDHDEVRIALNGKQCVLVIRRLAVAMKTNDEAEYQEALKHLDLQYKC